jgi:hypothetical protein
MSDQVEEVAADSSLGVEPEGDLAVWSIAVGAVGESQPAFLQVIVEVSVKMESVIECYDVFFEGGGVMFEDLIA